VLRAEDGLRDEYEALKRNLANVFRNDREACTEAKERFIESTLRRGGVEPRRRLRE
jgi:GrpB-like predicted nucleotidyltransferase (UPF0157 family)